VVIVADKIIVHLYHARRLVGSAPENMGLLGVILGIHGLERFPLVPQTNPSLSVLTGLVWFTCWCGFVTRFNSLGTLLKRHFGTNSDGEAAA
jgi:hypothetical protein